MVSVSAPTAVGRPALRIGRIFSIPVHPRTLVVTLVLLVLTVALAGWAMTLGDLPIPLKLVWHALTGSVDPADEGNARVIRQWRAPRVAIAVLGGACLGLSGAVFQSLTRNPLGSPDIIGFNTGAYTGALVALLVFSAGSTGGTVGALVGGLVAAFVVALFASRGGIQGFRLIVVGIAVSAVLASVNTYLILRSDLTTAMAAAAWGMGTFDTITWGQVLPILAVLVVLGPVLAGSARSLRLLEVGDDAASALGVNVARTRLLLIVLGVAFTAAVTASAGPILFVALAAPQVAHRLTRSAGVPLLASAMLGAFLLLGADVLAQRLLAPTQLPVGTVTVTLGGLYLVGLLVVRARKAGS